MKQRIAPSYYVIISAFVVNYVGFAPLAFAQDELKAKFARAQKQNAAELRQYTWTSRTELKVNGETKSVKVESVRYDATGQLQKTTVQSTAPAPPSGGALKQKMVEKKKEELAELIAGLGRLAQSYAHLTPDQKNALILEQIKLDPASQSLQIKAGNVVENSDSVTVWVDSSTFLFQRAEIDSFYENNPVHLSASFERLPNGPSHPSLVDLRYPAKEIEVTVQNSNYVKLQALPASPPPTAAAPLTNEAWPRRFSREGATLLTYQPQVDDWKEFKTLDWRMAFSIEPNGQKPVIGAATLQALTDVDDENHVVTVHDIKIMHTDFPSLDESTAARMGELLRTFLPPSVEVSLERIVACTPKSDSAPTVQLKNDPPRIFVSYKPAVLLDVDGDPVNVPIRGTNLEYVMNTRWPLFRDKLDLSYYFLAGEQWLKSPALTGPWSAADKLPAEMNNLASDEHFSQLKDFIPARANPGATIPTVFYSTVPAEVILFDGSPAYTAIPGTQLSYANNTESYVFTYSRTRAVYYLTSGRWFSAPSLDGPWTFATPQLPDDFRRIPASSPAAQVLASVPGTEEAKDAVLMAQIPTTATVDPTVAAASAQVTYDGTPKFAPIEGTSMQYATNTAQKVVQVGDVYYLCLNGVWFFATTPQGPWQTAPNVPQEIYTIPPSSPVYNVTYVTQTTLVTGEVQSSYTAGYLGAFVMGATFGAVIAGGTGYYYPPYVGYYPGYVGYPAYYAHPYSYGAASYYNSATGRYGVSQTAYGPYGSATRSASYNPYTGTASRSASVSTPYGTAKAGQAYNPYTGAYGATRQGSNAYSSWGSSAVTKNGQTAYSQHYSTAQGTTGSVQTTKGGAAVGGVSATGNSAVAGKTSSGDMYAGHDGNVYKNTGSGWEKYNNGSWNSVNTPSKSTAQQNASERSSSAQTQSLQNESQNRQRGTESSQRYQQRSSYSGGGMGGRRR